MKLGRRIADASRRAEIDALRKDLLAVMERTGDPLAAAFAQRDKPGVLAAAMEKLAGEFPREKTSAARPGTSRDRRFP